MRSVAIYVVGCLSDYPDVFVVGSPYDVACLGVPY